MAYTLPPTAVATATATATSQSGLLNSRRVGAGVGVGVAVGLAGEGAWGCVLHGVSKTLTHNFASRGGNVGERPHYKLKIFPPGKLTF